MIRYKNIKEQLKSAGYSTYRLKREGLISDVVMKRIHQGKMISLPSLDKICQLTGKQPQDLIEYVEE